MWEDLILRPSPWVKPFLPQQGFSTAQVLVTRVGKNLKDPKEPEPMVPLYPILQGETEEELLFLPPYQPLKPLQAPAIPPPRANASEVGPAQNTRHRRAMSLVGPVDSTVALPLQVAGPLDEEGNQPHQYWPFSTSDLYNWRSQNAKFSDNPRDLTNLLETVLFTHQPTWDGCQQLLQTLFSMEERERIQNEARKRVPWANGEPTTNID